MNSVLLVEDDKTIRTQLKDYLSLNNFKVSEAGTIKEAMLQNMNLFQVVVLDWNLPDGEGIDLLKKWRASGVKTPVIMLTAKSDVVDRILGLEFGSQDYMTKPYDPRELLARIKVQIRTTHASSDKNEFSVGSLNIDLTERAVFFNKKSVALTKMEFDLLLILSQSAGKVFTRDELLDRVWGSNSDSDTRTVDAHVVRLRQKLDSDVIETIRGLGYRYVKGEKK